MQEPRLLAEQDPELDPFLHVLHPVVVAIRLVELGQDPAVEVELTSHPG